MRNCRGLSPLSCSSPFLAHAIQRQSFLLVDLFGLTALAAQTSTSKSSQVVVVAQTGQQPRPVLEVGAADNTRKSAAKFYPLAVPSHIQSALAEQLLQPEAILGSAIRPATARTSAGPL